MTLYNDDCLKILRTMPDKSVDLVITDPPYEVSATNGGGSINKVKKLNQSLKDLTDLDITDGYDFENVNNELVRVMKKINIYIWCNKVQIPKYFNFYVNNLGCKFDIISWHKCLSGSTEVFIKNSVDEILKMSLKDVCRHPNIQSLKIWDGKSFSPIINACKTTVSDYVEVTLHNGNSFNCSLEHPFYVNNKKVLSKNLKVGDILDTVNLSFDLGEDYNYISNELAWLCGFYLANGSKQSHKIVSFALNKQKTNILEKIQTVCKQYPSKYYIFDSKKVDRPNSRCINVTSKVIESVIDTYITGKDAYSKHFTSNVWKSGKRILKNIIDGYLDGDGSFDSQNNRYRLNFTRKNYELCKDLISASSILNYKISLRKSFASFNNKKWATWSGEIKKEVGKALTNPYQIVDIKVIHGKKDLIDIEVDNESHTFALFDGVLTHNCNALPTYSNKYLSDTEYCLYFRKGGLCQPQNYQDAQTFFIAPINQKDKKLYKHPTIKPLDFMERFVRNSSKEGDTVLDCFMGSGTTGVACKNLKRNFIGIELSKEYFDIASDRIGVDSTEIENIQKEPDSPKPIFGLRR